MSASFSVSFDIRKAKWLEDESRRLGVNRSEIVRKLVDAGVEYLNKKDSVGYAEINFLEASEEEISHLMMRCSMVLKEKEKEKEQGAGLSTINNSTNLNDGRIVKDNQIVSRPSLEIAEPG